MFSYLSRPPDNMKKILHVDNTTLFALLIQDTHLFPPSREDKVLSPLEGRL